MFDNPVTNRQAYRHYQINKELIFVEDIGVEPMTLCVQGRCSSQLS